MSRDELLNSKSEYVRNCLTRITISEKDWEKRKRERLEEDQENQEKENLEEFIREKTKSQASNHQVEEPPSYHDVGQWDHSGVLETSNHDEEVLEHSRGMENKRRRLNDSVRFRSWCPPTHHHDYDLRRWWKTAEKFQNDGDKRKPPLKNVKKKSPSTMNLAWLSYWWKRMERQATNENKSKDEMNEQRMGA